MARATALEPEDRRRHLLTAARRVFAQKGYGDSVADIIAEAGVARGTFYNYFDSKKAVFHAVLDGVMEQVNEGIVPIDTAQPVAPQIAENLENLATVLTDDVCRLLFAEAPGADAEGLAALAAFYAKAQARLARALRRGQEMGLVREGDVDLRAICLLGLLKEPAFQAWLNGVPLVPGPLLVEWGRLLGQGVLLMAGAEQQEQR